MNDKMFKRVASPLPYRPICCTVCGAVVADTKTFRQLHKDFHDEIRESFQEITDAWNSEHPPQVYGTVMEDEQIASGTLEQ